VTLISHGEIGNRSKRSALRTPVPPVVATQRPGLDLDTRAAAAYAQQRWKQLP